MRTLAPLSRTKQVLDLIRIDQEKCLFLRREGGGWSACCERFDLLPWVGSQSTMHRRPLCKPDISPFAPKGPPVLCILIPIQIRLLTLEAGRHLGQDNISKGGLQSISKLPEPLLTSTPPQFGAQLCLGLMGASLFPAMTLGVLGNPVCLPVLSIPMWPPRLQNRPHRRQLQVHPVPVPLVCPCPALFRQQANATPHHPSPHTHLHQANLGYQISTRQSHLMLIKQNLRTVIYFKKKIAKHRPAPI